ncbi:hypothetical protein F2Q68_00034217 [Brassica cretica]|uniref:Uncharacterized protein n=1 Tax=Brassica cretica TaxID=69181 RepID=A0A8S9H4A3_BRACR|nr:hypothetical protein F2Q68_00034217 [Brassica cretica]
MSLIDGMISECGSETSRLAGELLELQGIWGAREGPREDGELLKEKKARKAKSSEVRRLQRQIEGDAGLASRGIREAKDALRSEFQACLAKISAFLGSLECIRNRDLALATIEGGMAVVQSFQSETPPTLEAEEARLSGCKGDLAVVDGDFDLILADLKSACFLPTCSEGPEGKDQVLGGDAAPGLDEATGEEGALKWPHFVFRDWPYVALNPRRSAAFYDKMDVQEFDVISTELGGKCCRLEFLRKICVKMFIVFLTECPSSSRDTNGCFPLTADLFSNIENVSRIKDNLLG